MTRARIAMTGLALVAALAMPCAAQQASPPSGLPRLEQRGATDSDSPIPLDARITSPVTIPTEAWGHYTFGRELDLLEIDIGPRGLTGYITLMGDKGMGKSPDRKAPLTFFFTKTRVGGDGIYFLTQEIHRLSYEFSGALEQSMPRDRSLVVGYSLVGTLTTHHLGENGSDRKTSRHVEFKRVMARMR
jgi:hypothetical protein